MRRRMTRQEDEAEINLTPMMDIVFNMLIFFIVTASFVKESGVDVSRPSAKTSETKDLASIFIAVTEDGQIWMDNRQVDIRAVGMNVQRMLAESPEATVVIQADKNSRTGLAIEVLDAAKAAGAKEVSIAAEQVD